MGHDGINVTEAQILAGRSPVPEAAPEQREVTDTQEAQRDGDGLKGKAFLAKGPKCPWIDIRGLENMDHVLEYGVM